jgi:diadenosine tetraphosphate (Ap4A) HIT family hydrolase
MDSFVTTCPFCRRIGEKAALPVSPLAAVIEDAYPRAVGHLLIVPRQHISDYFAVPIEVKREMWTLLDMAQQYLTTLHRPDGWTIRINVGEVAGQTVPHVHLHLLPRYNISQVDHDIVTD